MSYIRTLAAGMRTRGLRVSLDDRHGERMQARVRDAELKKVPYVVVIGKRDVERGDGVVRVRDVRRNTQDDIATGALIDGLVAEVSERRPE
jgi:threonyl-tRNA synthetase